MWIVPESQARMEKEKRKPMMDRLPYTWQPAGDWRRWSSAFWSLVPMSMLRYVDKSCPVFKSRFFSSNVLKTNFHLCILYDREKKIFFLELSQCSDWMQLCFLSCPFFHTWCFSAHVVVNSGSCAEGKWYRKLTALLVFSGTVGYSVSCPWWGIKDRSTAEVIIKPATV